MPIIPKISVSPADTMNNRSPCMNPFSVETTKNSMRVPGLPLPAQVGLIRYLGNRLLRQAQETAGFQGRSILQAASTGTAAASPAIVLTGLNPRSVLSTLYLTSRETSATTIGNMPW